MQKTQVVILSIPYTEPYPTVAPGLLSACLDRAGISSRGLDLGIEFIDYFINKPYWADLKNLLALGAAPTTLSKRAVIDLLKFVRRTLLNIKDNYDPDYIGLSIFTNESINFSYVLIPYIRRYLPRAKIMLGGRGLELTCGIENRFHYEKYWDHGMADLIVVGDAETAIIEAIQEEIQGIYFAKPQGKEDLENIPVPKWDDYDLELYKKFNDYTIVGGEDEPDADPRYISITGSKGCVRHCTFCDVASFWPKYLYRDGEKIAQEIINNYQSTGIITYRFTDNLINGSISHYRKMNERLVAEIPDTIKYRGMAIFRSKEQMPAEDYVLARKAGCVAWAIGVESGSERVRYELKKKFSNEDLTFGVKHLHKNHIVQTLLIMVGYPTETEKDYKETEVFLKQHAHLNLHGMIKLNITNTFMLLNNSPLIQNKELSTRYGLQYNINDNNSRFFWTADINPENTFDIRYDRWMRLTRLAEDLGYGWGWGNQRAKFAEELTNLKKVYDNYKPKKVYSLLEIK